MASTNNQPLHNERPVATAYPARESALMRLVRRVGSSLSMVFLAILPFYRRTRPPTTPARVHVERSADHQQENHPRVRELEVELDAARAELAQTQATLEAERARVTASVGQIRDRFERLSREKGEAEAQRDRAEELSAQASEEVAQTQATLEAERARVTASVGQIRDRFERLSREKGEAEAQRDRAKELLTQASEEVALLRDQNSEVVSRHQNTIATLQREQREATARIERLETELAQTASGTGSSGSEDTDVLKATLASYESEHAAITTKLRQAEDRVLALEIEKTAFLAAQARMRDSSARVQVVDGTRASSADPAQGALPARTVAVPAPQSPAAPSYDTAQIVREKILRDRHLIFSNVRRYDALPLDVRNTFEKHIATLVDLTIKTMLAPVAQKGNWIRQ
ncbi:MAG: hypothetical protein RL235_1120, partial [Chlamydiota bacterium]